MEHTIIAQRPFGASSYPRFLAACLAATAVLAAGATVVAFDVHSGGSALLELPPQAAWIGAAALVIFCAGLVSSIAGFAFSALAGAALLSLLGDPVRAVSVMVACSIAIQAYCVWALRRSIDWRLTLPFMAGGALTVPLGVWLLTRASVQAFALGLGLFLVVYGAYMLFRRGAPVLKGDWRADAAAGALGGVAGGLAGFPGSFVTIWCGMRGWSKEKQRAVYQPYILVMQIEAMVLLGTQAPASLQYGAIAVYVPVALLAAYLGLAIFRKMTTRQFGVTVNALLVVSGITLLAPALSL